MAEPFDLSALAALVIALIAAVVAYATMVNSKIRSFSQVLAGHP